MPTMTDPKSINVLVFGATGPTGAGASIADGLIEASYVRSFLWFA